MHQTIHGQRFDSPPLGSAYRWNLARDLSREMKGTQGGDTTWIDKAMRTAASALLAKGGACEEFASCVIVWCLMNAQCRVSRIQKANHVWVILSLGSASVVVDAWVRYPVICFPEECASWYGIFSGSQVANSRSVDVLAPQRGLLDGLLSFGDTKRGEIKAELLEPQELSAEEARGVGRAPGTIVTMKQVSLDSNSAWNKRTNFREGYSRQLGLPIGPGGPEFVALPDTSRLRGTSIYRSFGQ